MNVHVKCFAIIRDIVGSDELIVEVPENAAISIVVEKIIYEHPQIADWKDIVRVAVNREYVQNDHRLSPGDEVAIIPPVSGG